MTDAKSLIVDFSQEGSALQILPSSPILSSHPCGWNGIHFEYHQQPAWEIPQSYYTQHVVAIHHLEQTTQSERVLDGRRHDEQLIDGSIAIIPANILHQVNWDRNVGFTLLLLDPDDIAHIAYESVNDDGVEVIPQNLKSDPLIYGIGLAFKSVLQSNLLYDRLYVDSLTTTLFIHLLRNYCSSAQVIRDYPDKLPPQKIKQAINYIQTYLDQNLSLNAISGIVQMSPYYFLRLFKQSIGITPHQYVIQQRVERAKQLLKQQELSIADVALQCGFGNQSHLNRHFKRLTGVTPKDLRK